MEQSRTGTGNTPDARAPFVADLMRSTATALLSGLTLLLPAALIAYLTPDPDLLVRPLSLTALYSGCLTGGVVAMHRRKSPSGWVAAMLAAALTSTLLLAVAAMIPDNLFGDDGRSFVSAIQYAAVFPFFALGALIGKKPPSSSSRRGKRRRRRR